jgi:hypothetical protein
MKKKIKDLTAGEVTLICNKNNNCIDCPLHLDVNASEKGMGWACQGDNRKFDESGFEVEVTEI